MEKKLIIILSAIAVVIVLVGVLVASDVLTLPGTSRQEDYEEETDYNPLDDVEESDTAVVSAEATAKSKEVVNQFYSYLEQENYDQAFNLLATEAQELKQDDISVSEFITTFANVQTENPEEDLPEEEELELEEGQVITGMPEKGMEIAGVAQAPGDLYEVATTWHYNEGDVAKTFLVVESGGQYLIMAIQ